MNYYAVTPNLKVIMKRFHWELKKLLYLVLLQKDFLRKNINCSIDESLDRFREVLDATKSSNGSIRVRGYVSCVLGCSYENEV